MQMILKCSNFFIATFIASLIFSMSSCKKDDSQAKTEFFEPGYKDLQLSGGFVDNGIPIKAAIWSVEYVKDAVSGEMLQDKAGKPMALNALGSVELSTGWLKLEKKQSEDVLSISLKENFSASPRKFLIGILADGKRDELSFTQIRGEAYEIVKKEIKEIPGSRKEYTTDEGLHAITLTNNSSTAKNMETSDVYKDVHYISEFNSEDYGAFEWVKGQDSLLYMDEVVREGATYWAGKVAYKKGRFLEPYIKKGGSRESVLVQPHSSIKVRGEVVYLERECLYTFTVKNLSSGSMFDISGTWKQKIPLSPHTYLYDMPTY